MRVPTSEELREYETTPERVVAALEGVSEAHLYHTLDANEWSIHETVIHLSESELFASERFRRTIAEERPTLQVYPEALWAQRLLHQRQDMQLALTLFRAQRCATTALLRLLPAEAWERTGVHSERGDLTLYALFMMYLEHGTIHLAQIEHVKEHLS